MFRSLDVRLGRWFSTDPIFHHSFSPYNSFDGNPIYWRDPSGGNAWKPIGNGQWQAEAGDSALSLAEDANVPLEVADEIIQSQLGPNYIRESDGMLMSNVEVGDVVQVEDPFIFGESNFNNSSGASNANQSQSRYTGAGALEYVDELMSGADDYTSRLRHGGGHIAYSSSQGRIYYKPNARGLNKLKGASVNVNKAFKLGGPIVGALLEAPEIVDGYNQSTYEGNKQVAGGVGSVGGGYFGGVLAGAGAGLVGIETGPGVVVTVIVGAALGGYYGEEGVEEFIKYFWEEE